MMNKVLKVSVNILVGGATFSTLLIVAWVFGILTLKVFSICKVYNDVLFTLILGFVWFPVLLVSYFAGNDIVRAIRKRIEARRSI